MLGFVALNTVRFTGELKLRVPVTADWLYTPPFAVMPPAGMILTQLALPVATTSNRRSQLPRPDIAAPVMLTEPAPGAAVIDMLPAQVVYALGAGATTIPAGKVSVTCTFANALAPEFASRIVTVDLPPDETLDGEKLLVADRIELYTIDALALAVTGCVVPLAYVSVPAALAELLYVPAAPTTSTCRKQVPAAPEPRLALAGTVPPFIETDVVPAVAVIVGLPQVLAALAGFAICICAPPETGKVSEIDTAVSVLAE